MDTFYVTHEMYSKMEELLEKTADKGYFEGLYLIENKQQDRGMEKIKEDAKEKFRKIMEDYDASIIAEEYNDMNDELYVKLEKLIREAVGVSYAASNHGVISEKWMKEIYTEELQKIVTNELF